MAPGNLVKRDINTHYYFHRSNTAYFVQRVLLDMLKSSIVSSKRLTIPSVSHIDGTAVAMSCLRLSPGSYFGLEL